MNKKELKEKINKYAESITIQFNLNIEQDEEIADLSIEISIDNGIDDNKYITLETLIEGKEAEIYKEYNLLKKSYITKYNNWSDWLKENFRRTEIIENRIVYHL